MVVVVTVAPGPVFLLLVGRQLAKIPMLVVMTFMRPRVVISDLFVVPDVIVAIVGVVDPIVVSAAYSQCGACQRGRQETGTEKTCFSIHLEMILSTVDLSLGVRARTGAVPFDCAQ
jgi:hypothetical protein